MDDAATFTTRANVAFRNRGIAARVVRIMVSTPRSNSSSHAASVRSSSPPTCAGPTVFTSAWHSPQRSSRNVNAASTSPVSSRLPSSPMAPAAPAAASSSSAPRRWLGVRASTATRAPSAASSSAVARPTPRVPPATTVARPFKPRSITLVDSVAASRPSGRASTASPSARSLGGQLAGEVGGRERLAGGPGHQLVPAPRRPGREHLTAKELTSGALVDEPVGARHERRVELRREQLAVEVVLVVDGRGGEVDLGGPVGRVTVV